MLYQYSCTCSTWEEVCPVDDRDNIVGDTCPHCGSAIERDVTSSTFILKGSCWERDGYSRHLGDAVKRGGFKS